MAIRVAAVVVAAGRGTRSGLDYPKQYKAMGGSPMVRASVRIFTSHPRVDLVLPVIHRDDGDRRKRASHDWTVPPPETAGLAYSPRRPPLFSPIYSALEAAVGHVLERPLVLLVEDDREGRMMYAEWLAQGARSDENCVRGPPRVFSVSRV